jgi:acyl-coenzyme A thioesterase PaaI-like protein
MKKEILNNYPGQECFFCGEKNPIGLKLTFFFDEATGELTTDFLPSRPFAGLGNILHGGIQAGLFDEIMGWVTHEILGEPGVTTDLRLQFLKPVYLEEPLQVSCRLTSREGCRVGLTAEIKQPGGTTCTKAVGTYRLLSKERFDSLVYGKGQKASCWNGRAGKGTEEESK